MDKELFFFRGDNLPTNEEVFDFVNTRTKYAKTSQVSVLNELASTVHAIWQKADTCPLSKNAIATRGKKLLAASRHQSPPTLTNSYLSSHKNVGAPVQGG